MALYRLETWNLFIGVTPMRAEHEKLVSDIQESLALLRRSL